MEAQKLQHNELLFAETYTATFIPVISLHHNYPDPKETSSIVLFCPTDSPQPRDIQKAAHLQI